METIEKTVEITEKAAPAAGAPALPTQAELKEKGYSAEELKLAEKHGMVKPEAPKVEPKPEVKPEAKEPAKAEEKPPVAAPKQGGIPDYKFTPEEQELVDKNFGKGHPFRAFYFRAKNERHARQAQEARTRELEAEIAALKAPKAPELAEGEVDPDDQPLTAKMLRELQKKDAEEQMRLQQIQSERASIVTSAQTEQEEYARELFEDFDDTVEKAKEVMKNLPSLITERRIQGRVIELVKKLQVAAANADKFALDDDHAAMLAYEIGKFHPEYGQKPKETGTPKDNPKVNGGLTPDQMKRAAENTQRRASSASLPSGGGKRVVSVEDVTLAILNGMDSKERATFRKNHPEQYAKLLRG